MEELKGEGQMCQALLEIMEPEINMIKEAVREEVTREVTEEVTREVTEAVTREVTEAVTREVTEAVTREVAEEERRKGIRSTVVALRVCGQEDTAIRNAIMKTYDIPASEVEAYL